MSSMLVEEWRDLWSIKIDMIVASLAYVFATTNFLNMPRLILENGGCKFLDNFKLFLSISNHSTKI